MLIDITDFAPEDDAKENLKRKRSRKRKPPAPPPVDDDVQAPPPPTRTAFIGRVSDSGSPCPYCSADEWDIDDDFGQKLAVTCAFCSKLWSIPKPATFQSMKIRSGQLAGLTVAEAFAAGGTARRILTFLASKDPGIASELARTICRPASEPV